MGPLFEPTSYIPKRLALLGLTLGFIFFVQYLGFTITVFLFLSGAMLLLSNGQKKIFIISMYRQFCPWRAGRCLSGPSTPVFRPVLSRP